MELSIIKALDKGVEAHKLGKFKLAKTFYQAILKSQPNHPEANHNMGLLQSSIGKIDEALPFFKVALESNSNIEQFWLSYIDILIKKKQFKSATLMLEKAKEEDMTGDGFNILEAQKELGILGLYKSNNKKNKTLISEFIKAYFNLGNTLLKVGRLKEAESSFRGALVLDDNLIEVHTNLGVTLKEQGRLEEAQLSFRKAILINPNYGEAHYNLGITLRELGRLDEAEKSYIKTIKSKPDFAEAHCNLGNILKDLGRLSEAENFLKQSIALKPEYAEAHNNLGVVFKELGKLEEAEASYTKAIELKNGFISALMNRWKLLYDKGQFDDALKDLDLCNTETSRALSLETLYALGNVDEIFKRIEVNAELDDCNIRMAAFSSFIAEREKRDTAHKFCKNPLSFLYFSNLSSHLKNSNEFLKELIDELSNLQTIWEPPERTTFKGFQTLPNINIFENPLDKMKELESIIFHELDNYYSKFQNESCSYIKKFPSNKNLRGWHVILKKQGCQTTHIHTSGWLSGVIYLKVVPTLGKNEGAIEFSLNGDNYSDLNSPKLTYQPELGDIIFFPSSLHHSTVPFSTDDDRIIVSFDLRPDFPR
jgi:tetratricopeptide (TPR) repeat protein